MVAASLLSTFFFALAAVAQPVEQPTSQVKLAFSKRIDTSTGPVNLVEQDRLRVNHLKAGKDQGLVGRSAVLSSPADNRAVSYIATVGVGSPPTNYDLIIDSGSSNIWVGSLKPYVKTSTSSKTTESVSVSYGTGNFSGTEYIDRVTIGSELVVFVQSIGVADESHGFDTVNGIIGVGPTDLTKGTLSPDKEITIPTVTDNLYAQGTITDDLLGVSFEPITSSSGKQMNGELTWGGTDPSKFTGDITYAPITTTPPSSTFWGINASISYGGFSILSTTILSTPILSNTAGIVDTGTTTVQIATEAFDSYQKITGGVPDSATGLLSITADQYAKLQSLFFNVNDVAFELTPNAQIWPRILNGDIGGVKGKIYLIVQDIGTKRGAGLDFILGQVWLERFYSVYDTAHKRVGLATTSFTHATTN